MEVFLIIGFIALTLMMPFILINAINSVLEESGFDFKIKVTPSSWLLALIIVAIAV